jgi:hypothetical protein
MNRVGKIQLSELGKTRLPLTRRYYEGLNKRDPFYENGVFPNFSAKEQGK